MPFTELIRYFNAADRAGEGMLYPAGQRVEAWFGGLRLASLFRPIVDVRRERVVGHHALLAARHEDGTAADPEAVFALCENGQMVVQVDRLCRTLHALNFLAQRQATGGYLQLAVHPRHLQAVTNQHGLVYEAILKRCGLAPEDIVLDLTATATAPDPHFAQALAAYRQRGYRLAVHLPTPDTALTPELLALHPDILRLPARRPDQAAAARAADILVERGGIDSGSDWQQARTDGIDLAQGSLLGDPQADCLPTQPKKT